MAPVVLSVDLTALQTIELLIGFSNLTHEGKWRVPIRAIHEAVERLQTDYPDLLTDIWFEEYSIRPYSARIELALATLGATGFAEVSNPRYKSITVLDEHRAQFREHLASQFPPEVISRARQAAKQFDQALIDHPLLQERGS